MVFAAKFLSTVGAMIVDTCKVALAGVVFVAKFPLLSVAVTVPAGMVLIKLPAVVEVTFTVTVHCPFVPPTLAGTVPPLKEMLVPPVTALTVPPQLLLTMAGVARLIPG